MAANPQYSVRTNTNCGTVEKEGKRKKADNYSPDFEKWKAENNWRTESLKAIVQFAALTIRSLILINGGAVVVLMALLGSLWGVNENSATDLAKNLVSPFGLFIGGLIAGVGAGAFSYFAQVLFTEWPGDKQKEKTGANFRWVAIIFGGASIILFGLGSFAALSAFS